MEKSTNLNSHKDPTLKAPMIIPVQVNEYGLPHAMMTNPQTLRTEMGILKTVKGTEKELDVLKAEWMLTSPMANELMFLRLYGDGRLLQAFAQEHYPGKRPAEFPRVTREIDRVVREEEEERRNLFERLLKRKRKIREVLVPAKSRSKADTKKEWGFVQEEKGSAIDSEYFYPEVWLEKIFAGLQSTAITLAFLESEGVIHGDVKPAQILIKKNSESPDGQETVLVDFELAQKKAADGAWRLMSGKEKVGNPAFLSLTGTFASPEQIAFIMQVHDAGAPWLSEKAFQEVMKRSAKNYRELGIPITPEQIRTVPIEVSSKTDLFSFALSVLLLARESHITLSERLRALLQRATSLMPADRPTMKEFADEFVQMSVQDSLSPESLEVIMRRVQ